MSTPASPSRPRRLALGAVLGATSGFIFTDLGLQSLVSFWGSRTLIISLAVVAGALLGLTRLRVLLWTAAALLGALWLAVALTPLTGLIARDLIRSDPPAAADAVVVLGSNVQEDGDLTPAAQSRLLRAIELIRAGLAPRLIITEFGSHPPHAEAVKPALARLGIAAELIVVGPAYDTHQESLAVARLLGERAFHKVLLVTSPLHTRRAGATFEQAGVPVIVVPSVETVFDIETLAHPDDRLRAFGSVAHERLGLLVYRWRGWLR